MSLSQERVRRRISTSGLVTPEVVIEMLVFTIFRPPYAQFPGDDIPASPITPSVEDFNNRIYNESVSLLIHPSGAQGEK